MHHLVHRTRAASALALVLLASGCAGAKKKLDIVFPPPPDVGRVKLVRSILTEDDVNQSAWRKIWKAIVPHDSSNAVNAPTGLALSPDERMLYVAVPHRARVVAIDLKAGSFKAVGTGGQAPLGRPIGVAVDATGALYVTDKAGSAVVVYGPDGSLLRKFGREQLQEPTGIAVDRRNQLVYVVNDASRQEGRHTIEVYSLAGKHLRTIGRGRSSEPGNFNFPRSVSVSRNGELHVVDMLNFRVQVFDARGGLVRFFGAPGSGFPGQFDKIHSIGFDAFDNMYVADAVQGVHILSADTQPLMIFGAPVARAPSAVVVSSRNTIFVGDMLAGVHEFQLINTTAADSRKKADKADAKSTGAAARPAASTPSTTTPSATTQGASLGTATRSQPTAPPAPKR